MILFSQSLLFSYLKKRKIRFNIMIKKRTYFMENKLSKLVSITRKLFRNNKSSQNKNYWNRIFLTIPCNSWIFMTFTTKIIITIINILFCFFFYWLDKYRGHGITKIAKEKKKLLLKTIVGEQMIAPHNLYFTMRKL